MNTKRLKWAGVVFVAAMLLGSSALADPTLGSVFGNSMVLQRAKPIPVWGNAAPEERITVALNGKTATATADAQGAWTVTLPVMKAGGPFELVVSGAGQPLTLTNVLIGDVWVCSGQSNMGMSMQGTGRGILDGEKEIAAANYPNLRLFVVYPTIATQPRAGLASHSAWSPCNPKSVADFSAAAYFFGRHLHQTEHVPIGLVQTAWGGTYAEAWTSETGLASLPEFRQRLLEAQTNLPRLDQVESEYRPQCVAWEARMDDFDAGVREGVPVWSKPDCPTSDWTSLDLPLPFSMLSGTPPPKLGGRVWLRRELELPAAWQGHDLTLNLGFLRETGCVWFNGTEVGRNDLPYRFWDGQKGHVPASLVKLGLNTIVVRTTDAAGLGGLYAAPASFQLTPRTPAKELKPLSLTGRWLMKQGLPVDKLTPRPTPSGYWPNNPNMPMVLFNAMIHPLTRMPIKGVIWYQGESNAGRAYEYRRLFPTMIQDWRRAWGQGDFPFLFVQLAGFGSGLPLATEPRESTWAELREAQLMTLATTNTGMAVTIDIGELEDIHPINKRDVGIRLGLAAQAVAYRERLAYSGPLYRSMQVKDGKAHLTFRHAKGLAAKGGELKGFAIAGSDRKFRNAQAEIRGGQVVVWSDAVPLPVAVRYGWDFAPDCNLYNAAGLPASPFRTDDWPGVTAPKPEPGKSGGG